MSGGGDTWGGVPLFRANSGGKCATLGTGISGGARVSLEFSSLAAPLFLLGGGGKGNLSRVGLDRGGPLMTHAPLTGFPGLPVIPSLGMPPPCIRVLVGRSSGLPIPPAFMRPVRGRVVPILRHFFGVGLVFGTTWFSPALRLLVRRIRGFRKGPVSQSLDYGLDDLTQGARREVGKGLLGPDPSSSPGSGAGRSWVASFANADS